MTRSPERSDVSSVQASAVASLRSQSGDGAADDDPSGIATYSQAGAQFGFDLGWTLILTYPLMVAIQAISARIGRTTGLGIAGNLRKFYPPWLLHSLVGTLVFANVCNIGADLGAMVEATQLLVPRMPTVLLLLLFVFLCAGGQIFMHHKRYVALLKWLTLSLFSYFAVLAIVHVSWANFFRGLVRPTLTLNKDLWLMVAAILGTTFCVRSTDWRLGQCSAGRFSVSENTRYGGLMNPRWGLQPKYTCGHPDATALTWTLKMLQWATLRPILLKTPDYLLLWNSTF